MNAICVREKLYEFKIKFISKTFSEIFVLIRVKGHLVDEIHSNNPKSTILDAIRDTKRPNWVVCGISVRRYNDFCHKFSHMRHKNVT